MDIRKKVREFIAVKDVSGLSDTASLAQVVDSLKMLKMISFLESEYGITIEDQDIVPDNLDTIANIEAFVLRKKAG